MPRKSQATKTEQPQMRIRDTPMIMLIQRPQNIGADDPIIPADGDPMISGDDAASITGDADPATPCEDDPAAPGLGRFGDPR